MDATPGDWIRLDYLSIDYLYDIIGAGEPRRGTGIAALAVVRTLLELGPRSEICDFQVIRIVPLCAQSFAHSKMKRLLAYLNTHKRSM